MSPRDLLLALVVVVAWGVNFVVIKVGLHGVPPMLLGALRFTLAAVPAVFFIKRPKLPWRWLLAYGATIPSQSAWAEAAYMQFAGFTAGRAGENFQFMPPFTWTGQHFWAGYPVGVVTKVGKTGTTEFASIEVKPVAELDRSRHVLLLFNRPLRAEQGNGGQHGKAP